MLNIDDFIRDKRHVWVQLVDRQGNNYQDSDAWNFQLPPWTSIRELKKAAKKAFGNFLRETEIERHFHIQG